MLWHPKNISKKMEKRGKEKDKKKLCFLVFVWFLFVFCLFFFVLAWRKGIKRRKREREEERIEREHRREAETSNCVFLCVFLSFFSFFFLRRVRFVFLFLFARDNIIYKWLDRMER